MSGFLVSTAIVLLFLVCILAVLVILMQKPSANAGMGAALGGGAAESVFGGESANVLTKFTSFLTVLLFLLSLGLYLAFVAGEKREASALDALAKPASGEVPAPVPVVTPAAEVKPATPAPPQAPATPAPAAK
jgi:preprotein translocase subunit SecG